MNWRVLPKSGPRETPIAINVDQLTFIRTDPNGRTLLAFADGREIYVTESVDDVMDIIRQGNE